MFDFFSYCLLYEPTRRVNFMGRCENNPKILYNNTYLKCLANIFLRTGRYPFYGNALLAEICNKFDKY